MDRPEVNIFAVSPNIGKLLLPHSLAFPGSCPNAHVPFFKVNDNVHTRLGWFCDFKKTYFLNISLWVLVSITVK